MKKAFYFILVVFLLVLTFFIIKTRQFYKKIYTPSFEKTPQKSSYNFLLFGYGGGNHEGTYLTDTIIFLHVDIASKSAVMVSLPRDLWVKIPTKDGSNFHSKINAVYQMELFPENYPSLNQKFLGNKNDASFLKFIVGYILGQKIDYYAAIDFEGFKKAIDFLGGVEVNVEKDFTDYQYPIEGKEKDLCDQKTETLFKKAEPFLKPGYNPEEKEKLIKEDPQLEEFLKNATQSPHLAFPCRYETVSFKKGLTKMDGETALKFVRSRHAENDGGDFSRAKRQQLLLMAVKNKILSFGFLPKIFSILDKLQDHLKTDLPANQIKNFILEAKTADQYRQKTFVLSTENLLEESVSLDGQYILIPKAGQDNWQEIREKIKTLIKTP